MAAQYFAGLAYQSTPNACVVDITPPTFAGITLLTPRSNGSLRTQWSIATDATGPITYDIYIAVGTVLAAALFVPGNITLSYRPTGAGPFTRDIYYLPDGSYLVQSTTYTVGVRCRDGVGNENTNTALLTGVSTGVLPDNFAAIYGQLAVLVDTSSVVGGRTFVLKQTAVPSMQITQLNLIMEVVIEPQLIP